MKGIKRLANTIWAGGKRWRPWETTFWRISIVGAIMWLLLAFNTAFFVKPAGYVDTSNLTCERAYVIDGYLRGRDGIAINPPRHCSIEELYFCGGELRPRCEFELYSYYDIVSGINTVNDELVFAHKFNEILRAFSLLIPYFLAVGGFLALVRHFQNGAPN